MKRHDWQAIRRIFRALGCLLALILLAAAIGIWSWIYFMAFY